MTNEQLIWRLEAKAFPGSVIYLLHDLGDILIAQSIDIFSLWDVLADQAIGVFVEAPLPRMIGVSKEAWSHQLAGSDEYYRLTTD